MLDRLLLSGSPTWFQNGNAKNVMVRRGAPLKGGYMSQRGIERIFRGFVLGLAAPALFYLAGPHAFAQAAKVTVAPGSSGIKTTYAISSDMATVTSTIANGIPLESKMKDYLFQSFRQSLLNTAFVSSVTQTKGTETSESSQWYDYDTKKRSSHAFVSLALNAQLTMLFQIEESYRSCRPPKGLPVIDDETGVAVSGCTLQSSFTVRGPISVYGNFASSVNADALLRNKQEFTLTMEKSGTTPEATLTSHFSIKSVAFDESLSRFFRVFNIPMFVSRDTDVGIGGALLDKISPLTSRQQLLLGISRITRQSNERMLKP
jgi:hypothetical protein